MVQSSGPTYIRRPSGLGGTAKLGDLWMGGVGRYIDDDFGEISSRWDNGYAAAIYYHIQKMMLFGDPSLRIGGVIQQWDICRLEPELCDLLCADCVFRFLNHDEPLRFLDMRDHYVLHPHNVNKVYSNHPIEPLQGSVEVRIDAPRGGLVVAIYDDAGQIMVESTLDMARITCLLIQTPAVHIHSC